MPRVRRLRQAPLPPGAAGQPVPRRPKCDCRQLTASASVVFGLQQQHRLRRQVELPQALLQAICMQAAAGRQAVAGRRSPLTCRLESMALAVPRRLQLLSADPAGMQFLAMHPHPRTAAAHLRRRPCVERCLPGCT
jgi:hypothetical protein